MKHLLNNLSEQEKNSIREQYTDKLNVMTESFNKLLNSKLGDVKTITEQSASTPRAAATPTAAATPKPTNNVNNIVFKGKTVNLYNDALNTKLYKQIKILDEPKYNGGVVSINFGSDQKMSYDCTKPQEFKIVEPSSLTPLSYHVFNNKLASEFNGKFCQKNPMGKTVPKADYASVGSQSGSNIA